MNEDPKQLQDISTQSATRGRRSKFIVFILLFTILVIGGYFASAYYFNFWPFESIIGSKGGTKYLKGEVTIVFKDPDITPNEIQGFLHEYNLNLTKTGSEIINEPLSVSIKFKDPQPKPSQTEIKEMFYKLKKAPFITGVATRIGDTNGNIDDDIGFLYNTPKFVITYNTTDLVSFKNQLTAYEPKLTVIPREFLKDKYPPDGIKPNSSGFYEMNSGKLLVNGNFLLKNNQAYVIWDKEEHIELLYKLLNDQTLPVNSIVTNANNIGGPDFELIVDGSTSNEDIYNIFKSNSQISTARGYIPENKVIAVRSNSVISVNVPVGEEEKYITLLSKSLLVEQVTLSYIAEVL